MSRAAATPTYRVDFRERPAPRPAEATQGRVPRVARRLALAHRIEALVRAGVPATSATTPTPHGAWD